jgi:hypothetical protein
MAFLRRSQNVIDGVLIGNLTLIRILYLRYAMRFGICFCLAAITGTNGLDDDLGM